MMGFSKDIEKIQYLFFVPSLQMIGFATLKFENVAIFLAQSRQIAKEIFAGLVWQN